MKLEKVELPKDSHLDGLYSVKLEDGDFAEPTDRVKALVYMIIPDANDLTWKEFTRQVQRRYAAK